MTVIHEQFTHHVGRLFNGKEINRDKLLKHHLLQEASRVCWIEQKHSEFVRTQPIRLEASLSGFCTYFNLKLHLCTTFVRVGFELRCPGLEFDSRNCFNPKCLDFSHCQKYLTLQFCHCVCRP